MYGVTKLLFKRKSCEEIYELHFGEKSYKDPYK